MAGQYGGRKKTDPLYGRGEHSIDTDEWIDEAELAERILAAFRSPHYRPPTLPAMAVELLELSRRPEVEFDDVTALLEQDAMLAGNVLRIAQSPLYARGGKIQSLNDALLRLGLKTLRDLVMEVVMNMRVFRAPVYTDVMERVGRHSTATAHCARIVSKYTPMEGEYAFLCGLLHDVGVAGTLIVLGDVPKGKTPPDLVDLWTAIDRSHAEASAVMVKLWELPAEISLVLGAHHDVRIDGFDHPLAAIVCLADEVANELGLGLVPAPKEDGTDPDPAHLATHSSTDRSLPAVVKRAREALRIDDRAMELIYEEARKTMEEELGG